MLCVQIVISSSNIYLNFYDTKKNEKCKKAQVRMANILLYVFALSFDHKTQSWNFSGQPVGRP